MEKNHLPTTHLLEHVDEDCDLIVPLPQGVSEREQLTRRKVGKAAGHTGKASRSGQKGLSLFRMKPKYLQLSYVSCII